MANVAFLDVAVDVRFMYFESRGFPPGQWAKLRVGPVVRRDEVDYHRELRMLQPFTVNILLAGLTTAGLPLPRPSEVIERRARRGDTLPGFGHPLYPGGDPRARTLLDAAARIGHGKRARTLLALAGATTDAEPNTDLGLAALVAALGAPPAAGTGLFAVARAAGWLAHALEQRASGHLLRPRARVAGGHDQLCAVRGETHPGGMVALRIFESGHGAPRSDFFEMNQTRRHFQRHHFAVRGEGDVSRVKASLPRQAAAHGERV